MYVESFSRTFLVCLFTLVLTACGGGSGGGGGSILAPGAGSSSSSGGGSGPSTGTITLEISGMVNAAGQPDNVLAGNEVATLTANVTENGDEAELVVLFTTSIGRLLQESAQATGGVATVQITGDGTPGAATVTASATLSDGTQISASITVQTSADGPNIQLLDAAFAPATAVELLAGVTSVINAEVLDWDNTPISGVGISFVSSALDINTTSGVTDSNGRFSVTLTGTSEQKGGTLKASATFGSFSLEDEITANSLGVDAVANSISLDAIDLGTDGVLDGNEKVSVIARVLEEGVAKNGISVTFTTTGGTLLPASATSAGGGLATVQLTGDGIAGTAEITASATLSNGIAVSATQIVQTTAVTPVIDLVVRNQAGVSITQFGSNEELTLEATIVDHDGGALVGADAATNVTFNVGTLGTASKTSDVTEFQVCPVNGVKQATDCAFVLFTSNATAAVGSMSVTATINGIVITDSVTVTNTGANVGSADQNSFTITRQFGGNNFAISDTLALEGDEFNDISATIKVDLADFFNNPVPDGTLVEFTAELGDISSNCQTLNGECSVTYVSADPRAPNNSEVSFKVLDDDNCPSEIVFKESVTADAAGNAMLDYRVKDILGVSVGATVLTETTHFNQRIWGVDCVAAPCSASSVLTVTYRRAWLDEEDDSIPTHVLLNPGVGTEPFLAVQGTPCLAPARARREQITGSINPAASTTVAGVGTLFLEELAIGDRLRVLGEVRGVTAIASNTSLTVDAAFTDGGNDVSPERLAAPAYLGGMGQPYGGRSTILAYAIGEESFVDVNGNDEYDFGESFDDLSEAILDKNEDTVLGDVNGDSATAGTTGPYRDAGLGTAAPGEAREKSNPFCYGPKTIIGIPGDGNDSTEASAYCFQNGGEEEIFIDADNDGIMDVGNGIYNGSRCLRPLQDADGGGVDDDVVCTTELLNVSKQVQILLAGTPAEMGWRAGSGAGTDGWGELITGIANRGGTAFTASIPDPEDWTTISSTALDNTFGARVNTQPLDTNASAADNEEDVSVFSIPNPFTTTQATYTLSFDVANYTTGAVEVFAGGQPITLDAACGAAGTCTATGFTVGTGGALVFAVADSGGGTYRLVADITNVSLTGTTTGIVGDFRSTVAVVPNNNVGTVTDFNVSTANAATNVMPGVSERLVGGVLPIITTSLTSGTFWFTDKYNGQLPEGTTVEIESDNRSGCSLTSVGGVAVAFPDPGPDTGGVHSGTVIVGSTASIATSYSVASGGGGGGSLVARVTTPSGTQSVSGISCNLLR